MNWLMLIVDRYRKLWFVLWFVAVLALTYASLSPRLGPPGQWNLDKLLHAGAYMGTTLIGLLAVRRRWSGGVMVALTALLGVCLELGQAGVPGRQASLMDGAANAAGVAVGLLSGAYVKAMIARRRQVGWQRTIQ